MKQFRTSMLRTAPYCQSILRLIVQSLFTLIIFNITLPSFGQTTTASLSPTNPPATTIVPLLFPENRNDKGDIVPVPERLLKILNLIEKELSIQFKFSFYPWNRAVNIASNEGGLIFGLSITPEREKTFTFSEPALYNYLWIVTCAGEEFSFSSIEDLKGKTIGVLRGSKYGGAFDQQKNKLFKVEDDVDAYSARLKKLHNRRMNAIVFASPLTSASEVEAVVNNIIPDESEKSQRTSLINTYVFSVLQTPILKDSLRFASFNGHDDELISRINKAIAKISRGGHHK